MATTPSCFPFSRRFDMVSRSKFVLDDNIGSGTLNLISKRPPPWELPIQLGFSILATWCVCECDGEGNRKQWDRIICKGAGVPQGSLYIGLVECWMDALGCTHGKVGVRIPWRQVKNCNTVGSMQHWWYGGGLHLDSDKNSSGEARLERQIESDKGKFPLTYIASGVEYCIKHKEFKLKLHHQSMAWTTTYFMDPF